MHETKATNQHQKLLVNLGLAYSLRGMSRKLEQICFNFLVAQFFEEKVFLMKENEIVIGNKSFQIIPFCSHEVEEGSEALTHFRSSLVHHMRRPKVQSSSTLRP